MPWVADVEGGGEGADGGPGVVADVVDVVVREEGARGADKGIRKVHPSLSLDAQR